MQKTLLVWILAVAEGLLQPNRDAGFLGERLFELPAEPAASSRPVVHVPTQPHGHRRRALGELARLAGNDGASLAARAGVQARHAD